VPRLRPGSRRALRRLGGTTEADRQRLRRQQQEAAEGGHTPGLSARGNGVWAVSVRYRRRDGRRAQLSTTVTGGRAAALIRLAELRAQADALTGKTSDDTREVA
jgi:hypothetical protein